MENLKKGKAHQHDDQRRRNRGALGACAPQDFASNKEVPILFAGIPPFSLIKKVPLKCCASQAGDASYIPDDDLLNPPRGLITPR